MERRRSAISRTNRQAAAPHSAARTFQVKPVSGVAADNQGQSKPCPEKYATQSASSAKNVKYRRKVFSVSTIHISSAAAAIAASAPKVSAVIRATLAPSPRNFERAEIENRGMPYPAP